MDVILYTLNEICSQQYMDNIVSIAQLVSITVNLFIALLVLSQKKRSVSMWLFLLMVAFLILWSVETIFIYNQIAENWMNMQTFCSGTLLLYSLVLFSSYFPRKVRYIRIEYLILASTPAFLVCVFTIFNQVVRDAMFVGSTFVYTPGPLYILFPISIVFYVIIAFLNFIYSYRHAVGIEKVQLSFILIGALVTTVLALTTDVFLPALGFFQLNNLGSGFSIIFDAAVVYVMMRHRFFGIRFIVGNCIYGLILVAYVYGVLLAVLKLETVFLHAKFPDTNKLIFAFVLSLIAAVSIIILHVRLTKLYTVNYEINNLLN